MLADSAYIAILHTCYGIIVFAFILSLLNGRTDLCLYIFMFSLPLKHIFIAPGGYYLELWKVLSLISIPWTILNLRSILEWRPAVYFIVFIVISIEATFTGPLMANIVSQFRNIEFYVARAITQHIQLAAFLNLLIFPFFCIGNDIAKLLKAIKVYISTMVFLAILGAVQLYAHHYHGMNIFPIPRIDQGIQHENILYNHADSIFEGGLVRISSLSLEAKNYAFFLVCGLIFLLEYKSSFKRSVYGPILDYCILVLFMISLYFSYSTLGITMLALYALHILMIKGVKFKLVVVIFLLIISASIYWFDLEYILKIRSLERLAGTGGLEEFDLKTIRFLLDNPEFWANGVGYGNIHLYIFRYPPFPEWLSEYHKIQPNMGSLYVLGSTGMLGFIALTAGFISAIRKMYRWRAVPIFKFALSLLIFFTGFYMVRHNEFVFLALGISLVVFKSGMGRTNSN